MNASFLVGWMLWSAFAAMPPSLAPVPTVLGPKGFRDGDVIIITDVQSTSPRLEQGDTVTVRGRFRLKSREDAHLALYLTATEGDGVGKVDPQQTMHINGPRGAFELTTTIENRGVLHVTLYDSQTGQGFGGVYFGTADQMKGIEGWDWAYYRSADTQKPRR